MDKKQKEVTTINAMAIIKPISFQDIWGQVKPKAVEAANRMFIEAIHAAKTEHELLSAVAAFKACISELNAIGSSTIPEPPQPPADRTPDNPFSVNQ